MSKELIFYPELLIGIMEKNGQKLQFKKGEYIYHPGDKTEFIYMIKSGEVLISRTQIEGTELVTNFLSKKGIFGAVTLFCGPKNHASFAKAKAETTLYKIARKEFEEIVLSNEDVKTEWMRWIEIDRQRAITKMRDSMMFGKIGALCAVLIRLSNSFGEVVEDGIRINTKITNQEMGQMCGTSREVVNRLLKDLIGQGIVSVENKVITIHNIDHLRHIVSCEDCHIDICQVF